MESKGCAIVNHFPSWLVFNKMRNLRPGHSQGRMHSVFLLLSSAPGPPTMFAVWSLRFRGSSVSSVPFPPGWGSCHSA